MIRKEDIKKVKDSIFKFSICMTILDKNAKLKKSNDVIDSIFVCLINSDLDYDDFIDFIDNVDNDNILDLSIFDYGGNIDDFIINKKFSIFVKELFCKRPVGLRTPNCACGEGELMCLACSNKIIKANKNDLKLLVINPETNENEEKIMELKGEEARVFAYKSGENFNIDVIKICNKYGLTPNISKKTNLKAVELEKSCHLKYWNAELLKLNIIDRKKFLIEWIDEIDKNFKFNNISALDNIIKNDIFNQSLFIKEIIKHIYNIMSESNKFNKLVLLRDGTNCKIILNVIEFNSMIDNDELIIGKDFFRINQNRPIGWYVN